MNAARRGAVAFLVCLAALACAPATASAARPASKAERTAIKHLLKRKARCYSEPSERRCRFRRARVSTRNPRYAWAVAIGEGASGFLVKRNTAHTLHFRITGRAGGGAQSCSYWQRRAPRAVRRDLRLFGVDDAHPGGHICA